MRAFFCFLAFVVVLPLEAQCQQQAFKLIPDGHKFKRHAEHLVDLDIELKNDAIIHIIGRCPIKKISGGATFIWSGVAIDAAPNEYWMYQPSMHAVTIDSANEVTLTTAYAMPLKAGKHKIYWNFAPFPAVDPIDNGEFESPHGGTFLVQAFSESIGVEKPQDGIRIDPLKAESQKEANTGSKIQSAPDSTEQVRALQELAKSKGIAGSPTIGKPYFFAASDSGEFTFWILIPDQNPPYKSYSVDATNASGQTIMKLILAGFEQKAQKFAVYVSEKDPNKVQFLIVYP